MRPLQKPKPLVETLAYLHLSWHKRLALPFRSSFVVIAVIGKTLEKPLELPISIKCTGRKQKEKPHFSFGPVAFLCIHPAVSKRGRNETHLGLNMLFLDFLVISSGF